VQRDKCAEGRLVGHAVLLPGVNKRCPASGDATPGGVSRAGVDANTPTDEHAHGQLTHRPWYRRRHRRLRVRRRRVRDAGPDYHRGRAGTDPASLPPLRDSIDPDVLNSFFQSGGESAKALSFEYLCYDVVVTDDSVISYAPERNDFVLSPLARHIAAPPALLTDALSALLTPTPTGQCAPRPSPPDGIAPATDRKRSPRNGDLP